MDKKEACNAASFNPPRCIKAFSDDKLQSKHIYLRKGMDGHKCVSLIRTVAELNVINS